MISFTLPNLFEPMSWPIWTNESLVNDFIDKMFCIQVVSRKNCLAQKCWMHAQHLIVIKRPIGRTPFFQTPCKILWIILSEISNALAFSDTFICLSYTSSSSKSSPVTGCVIGYLQRPTSVRSSSEHTRPHLNSTTKYLTSIYKGGLTP